MSNAYETEERTIVLSPQEERIAENNGQITFSLKTEEKSRIQKIFDSFKDSKSVVDVQRARYFTESFMQTEGEALSLRWAKALYHIAEKIEVTVDPYQLLAGRVGKAGKYGLLYPELDGCFLRQFVKQAQSRVESPFEISSEDIKIIENEIAPYWEGKTYYDELSHAFPEDVLRVTYEPKDLFTSRYIVNETSSMRSALQWVHDYQKGIDEGFEAIKAEAQKKLSELNPLNPEESVDKTQFLQSVIIVSDAIILWAHRHAIKAKELAETKSDSKRKVELLKITEICDKVPRYGATTFYEAVQSQWFIQMFSRSGWRKIQ